MLFCTDTGTVEWLVSGIGCDGRLRLQALSHWLWSLPAAFGLHTTTTRYLTCRFFTAPSSGDHCGDAGRQRFATR